MKKKLLLLLVVLVLFAVACQSQSDEPAAAEVTASKELGEMVEIITPPPGPEADPPPVAETSAETGVAESDGKDYQYVVGEPEADPPPVAETSVETDVAESDGTVETTVQQFELHTVGPAELVRGERDDGTVYFIVRTTDADEVSGPSFDTGEMPAEHDDTFVDTASYEIQPGYSIFVEAYLVSPPCYAVTQQINELNIADFEGCKGREADILALISSTQ